jgi:hypothetical protein
MLPLLYLIISFDKCKEHFFFWHITEESSVIHIVKLETEVLG